MNKKKIKAPKLIKNPEPCTPVWFEMHVGLCVMVEGQRQHAAEYLRSVANDIEHGSTSGITGPLNLTNGKWFANR